MQKLRVDRHLSLGTIESEKMPRSPRVSPRVSPNLDSVCQRQVAELVEQLPLLGAWIVYRDRPEPLGERHRVKLICEDRSGFDPEMVPELESEVWLHEQGDRFSEKAWENVYFYPLFSRVSFGSELGNPVYFSPSNANLLLHLSNGESVDRHRNLDEYLLLWANLPFSSSQQQAIEHRVKFLNDYLMIFRDNFRQREEIQLLEQAIVRTEHQLRNSLGIINLYAKNIEFSLSDSELKEQAIVMGNTVREMSQNLTQLLTWSAAPKHHVSLQKFSICLASILRVLEAKINQKNIQINYPENSLEFEFDPWEIKQAFENFLSNAIEFSPWGGVIDFQWQELRTEVLIKISDRGPGFSAEDLKNALNPYYSKRPGGTGLGLAIAKKIILDHQGSIWLDNLPEGGAQVSVILPRYAP